MKIRTASCPPLVTLRWNEYRKRSLIERFPLSVLCGMLVLALSLNALCEHNATKTVTEEPLSVGLAVIEVELSKDNITKVTD